MTPLRSLAVLVIASLLVTAGCSNSRQSAENDRLRRENHHLKESVDTLQQKLALRVAEIDTINAQQATTKPSMPGADIPRVVAIRIGSYSGVGAPDAQGVSKLRIYLETIDQQGRFLPVAGRATVQAVAIQPNKQPSTLIQKTFEPKELNDAYRSGIGGTHFTLETPVPKEIPADLNEATVKVTFTDAATGVTVAAEKPMRMRFDGK